MLSDQTDDNQSVCEPNYDEQPTGERWDPLGANDLDNEVENITQNFSSICSPQCSPHERVRALEEEQELLNASLFQLTTHFAQVQFRLRQVVDAPPSEKEHLLKSLEEFAFRGVSEPIAADGETRDGTGTDHSLLDRLTYERNKQFELIEQIKTQLNELMQLNELDSFQFESKDVTPQYLLEKQRVLIDELKQKINLTECGENRSEGDGASPITTLKMKEQLINQFKTQIADLEQFVQFLQKGTSKNLVNSQCTCSCPVHGANNKAVNCHYTTSSNHNRSRSNQCNHDDEIRNRTIGIMKKAATLLQMFIVMQFGCGNENFKRNNLKACYNHWGDLRARLELAVAKVEELLKNREDLMDEHHHSTDQLSEYASDTEESAITNYNNRITQTIRKNLAPAIRDLMQHGLIEAPDRTSVVPFIMCFSARSGHNVKKMHAWELILQYYELKNGKRYNTTPARKLSQSFNLDLTDSGTGSRKQHLLSTIASIIETHTPYKRSYDAHFKAFVCAALNANKLVVWLSLILQCKRLITSHYHSWSYVIKTGFQDSLQSLDRLTPYKFELPVDLAVQHFQNIKDVFM